MSESISNPIGFRLIIKLWVILSVLVIAMAISFVLITNHYSQQQFMATQQRLNSPLAQHVIDEKFSNGDPYLEDGSINKALFGDLMHDMMAVNRSIEVYLLGADGEVLYSVVLDHGEKQPVKFVDTEPIYNFIKSAGNELILGKDPRDFESDKIFSAAQFEQNGSTGFVYIILSGASYEAASRAVFGEYLTDFGLETLIIAVLFTLLLGALLLWLFTSNLRQMTRVVQRFKNGDMKARILNPKSSDLTVFASTFNDMADTLEENVSQLQGVDSLRRQLVANISHDLRTPLSVLKGYSETVLEKHDLLSKEEQLNYLKIINSNSDKLNGLVEQLFEYSKLEAKQIEPYMERFNITDLCLDLVAKFQLAASQKQIKLLLENSESSNIIVYADIGLIERAMTNLLENALKFTPQDGTITISVEKNHDQCKVMINDTGIGIKEENHHLIFERFGQESTEMKHQGAGIGLAIVKRILELHDSTIELKSKYNSGSTFSFQLPAIA